MEREDEPVTPEDREAAIGRRMTVMVPRPYALVITDADKQAACDLIGNDTYGKPVWAIDTISPENRVVQAFARHRISALTSSVLSGDAGEENPNGIAENKAGGLWYRRWFKAQQRVNELERTHKFWRAGEVSCPSDIKAGNGELHTLRCKVCGMDNPRANICKGVT